MDLQFPSGTTVSQAKKDAKKYKRLHNCTQTQALNIIAQKNGLNLNWDRAVKLLKETQDNLLPDIFSNDHDQQLRRVFSNTSGIVIFSGITGSGKRAVAGEVISAYSPITKKREHRSLKQCATEFLTLDTDIVFSGELRHPPELMIFLLDSTSTLGLATVNAFTINEALQHLINIGLTPDKFGMVKAVVHCSNDDGQLDVELQLNPFENFHLPVHQ